MRVLVVAGEASGDMHAARLITAMREQAPALEVVGLGGERLRGAGMRTLVDTNEVATMGITEIFTSLGRLLSAYRRLVRALDEQRPELVILVDYPDFNLRLAKQAHRRGIPVFYFIGPQVWAWRRGRVRQILARVDKIALVFPFEPQLYAEEGGNSRRSASAEFIGHPLLDTVAARRSREETLARYRLDPSKPVLALLPGSRKKEIALLLPPLIEAAGKLAQQGWQPIVALAHTLTHADLSAAAGGELPFPVADDDTYNVVAAADVAVVTSGTATLETALLARPMVIVYRVSRLSYAIARALVRVQHIGMPNIILGRRAFPELLQDAVRADNIIAAVGDVHARRRQLALDLAEIRTRLGEPGAIQRAARMALSLIQSKRAGG